MGKILIEKILIETSAGRASGRRSPAARRSRAARSGDLRGRARSRGSPRRPRRRDTPLADQPHDPRRCRPDPSRRRALREASRRCRGAPRPSSRRGRAAPMRFETLHLERYGHFTGRSLDLRRRRGASPHRPWPQRGRQIDDPCPRSPTSCSAFPAQTTFNFLHDYESLRIGATIVSQCRRKARLQAAQGQCPNPAHAGDGVAAPRRCARAVSRRCRSQPFEKHVRSRSSTPARGRPPHDGERRRPRPQLVRGRERARRGGPGPRLLASRARHARHARRGSPPRSRSGRLPRISPTRKKPSASWRCVTRSFKPPRQALAEAVAAKAGINEELAVHSRAPQPSGANPPRRPDPDRDRSARAGARRLRGRAGPSRELRGGEAELRKSAFSRRNTPSGRLERPMTRSRANSTRSRPAIRLTRFAAEIGALQTRLGEYLKGVADEPKLARDIARFDDEIGRLVASLGIALGPDEAERQDSEQAARLRKSVQSIRDGAILRTKLDKARDEFARAKNALAAAEDEMARLEGDRRPGGRRVAPRGGGSSTATSPRISPSIGLRAPRPSATRTKPWGGSRAGALDSTVLAATAFPTIETIHDHEQRCQKLEIAKDAAVRRLAEAAAELRDIAAGCRDAGGRGRNSARPRRLPPRATGAMRCGMRCDGSRSRAWAAGDERIGTRHRSRRPLRDERAAGRRTRRSQGPRKRSGSRGSPS